MVRKGNLAVFEGSSISETGEVTPTKIGMHAFDINPYLHDFFRSNTVHKLFGQFSAIFLFLYIIHGTQNKMVQNLRKYVHAWHNS